MNSPNQSDSDDWTLVSSPNSPSTSPERLDRAESERYSSNSSLEHIEHDGLTEIDLNESTTTKNITTEPKSRRAIGDVIVEYHSQATVDGRASSIEPVVPGFQAIDSATDDEASSKAESSRRSSLTQSELGEYVDIGKTIEESNAKFFNETATKEINDSKPQQRQKGGEKVENLLEGQQTICLATIKARLDELSEATLASHRDKRALRFARLYKSSGVSRMQLRQWLILHLVILLVHVSLNYILFNARQNYHQPHNHQRRADSMRFSDQQQTMDGFNSIDSIPSSHQYVELQLLHSELRQCIKRQSPTSFKYYMSDDKSSEQLASKPHYNNNNINLKPYRGLVCYGQEIQWRKRFDRLKSEHNLDLRRLMQEAKKHVTNEMLEFYHPSLQFKLILNQIEYLDFIENKRTKKLSEETIKHLKAENLQLLRRLNQPDDTSYQKMVVNLELENSRLQRENRALKANLVEKAGTTYIKQALELEQYERENLILKQFHYQIAQDISKSSKQFNLHTIDTVTNLDDQESLNLQLSLTRGHFHRLSERISATLIENESLKEELKEAYLMNVDNNLAAPAVNSLGDPSSCSYARAVGSTNNINNNNSNALMADGCVRNLIELKERSNRLEAELASLRNECSRSFNGSVGLEKISERHLNRTKESLTTSKSKSTPWKQLGPFKISVDEKFVDSLPLIKNAIYGDFRNLVEKLNSYIDSSKSLALRLADHEFGEKEVKFLAPEKQANRKDESKIIPNYIREAIRFVVAQSGLQIDSTTVGPHQESHSPSKLTQPLPPTPQMPNPTHRSWTHQSSKLSSPPRAGELLVKQEQGSSKNVTSEETETESTVQSAISPGSWIFKRAKQRKRLRKSSLKGAAEDEASIDWAMLRAKFREKLRKASAYIEDEYRKATRKSKFRLDEPKLQRPPSMNINHRYIKDEL